jgi:hypothetical protein
MCTTVVNASSNFPLTLFLLHLTESCLMCIVVVVVYSGEEIHTLGLSQNSDDVITVVCFQVYLGLPPCCTSNSHVIIQGQR